jgi:archaeal flagellar protein FlaJ
MRRPENPTKLLPIMILAIIIAIITYVLTKKPVNALIAGAIGGAMCFAYILARKKLLQVQQIKKMESAFPDFLQLVASNLRAGITIDRALVISSRKEFAPLDAEINQLGRDLVTGKQIGLAMKEMSQRIKSEKLTKTINLIITGMKSGGDISTLLEETATNMREREFVEKRAASNVLMYVILIFFGASVGAPALFGLSTVLVGVLKKILGNIPPTPSTGATLPFAMTNINISVTFITYFAIVFLIAINILASLVIGLVQKGDEKEGVRFILPMVLISITVFLVIRIALTGYFSSLVG